MVEITREEHTEKIMQIKNLIHEKDDGSITSILADLSDDYGGILANINEINLANEKLSHDNENLRDTNMRLFLRVGGDNPPAEHVENTQKLEYENLFNEKGELK